MKPTTPHTITTGLAALIFVRRHDRTRPSAMVHNHLGSAFNTSMVGTICGQDRICRVGTIHYSGGAVYKDHENTVQDVSHNSYGYTVTPVSSKNPDECLCPIQQKRDVSRLCSGFHLKDDTSVTPMYTRPGSFSDCAGLYYNDKNCWSWVIDQAQTTCAFYSKNGREMVDDYSAVYYSSDLDNPDLTFYDSSCFQVDGYPCKRRQ